MYSKIRLIIIQIIYYQCNILNTKALIGRNVLPAHENEFPSVVGIKEVRGFGPQSETIICTGTLISLSHVLTAEHCFAAHHRHNPIKIIIGSVNIRRGTRHCPIWWLPYEHWASQNNQLVEYQGNDITVLKLLNEASENIVPATLSTRLNQQLYDVEAVVVGFGVINTGVQTGILDKANLTVLSRETCNIKIHEILREEIPLPEQWFCTKAEPYILLSVGDSGGPLFENNVILGVSMGNCPKLHNEFHPEKVNIHNNVAVYANFFNYVLQI